MNRLILAFRAFFRVLFNAEAAQRVQHALEPEGGTAERPEAALPAQPPAPAAPAPVRSEALTLLAALQREARLVDLIQESLEGYSDAQVGAAARDVLRDSASVLSRLFDLQPVVESVEGAEVDVAADFDPGRFRLVGNVAGEPPHRGRLLHHGWEATRCDLPAWSGSDQAHRVVAAAEIEVK